MAWRSGSGYILFLCVNMLLCVNIVKDPHQAGQILKLRAVGDPGQVHVGVSTLIREVW